MELDPVEKMWRERNRRDAINRAIEPKLVRLDDHLTAEEVRERAALCYVDQLVWLLSPAWVLFAFALGLFLAYWSALS